MNLLPPPPWCFGIPMHTKHLVVDYPINDNMTWIKHTTVVWVDIGQPLWQGHIYTAWCFQDNMDEFGLVRGFDVSFDGVGDWDPSAIPPPEGEMTNLDTNLAQSGHQQVPTVPKPTVVEPDPKPEES